MIKRVFWVALFTGLSHLISLITISYIIRELGEETSGYLGVIDSTMMVVASIISFGIQLAVNRNVATKTSWKSNYKLGQSARFMLSLFVLVFGIVAYLIDGDLSNLIYCYAPLVALNGDYALYGNGKPIVAASLSFLRVALPNIGILVTGSFFGPEVLYVYVLLLALGIFLAGVISANVNHVSYFFLPRKNFVKFYFKYLKVGIYQVTSVLIVTGVLVIANWFYSIVLIGLINGLLKILIIYKGGLRIIVQTFFKEIKLPGTSQKIDKASILAWGAISIPVIIFYDTTLHLLFDTTYDEYLLLLPLLGFIMLLSAFRNSAEAKALIEKKDNLNLYVFISALVIEILVMAIFSVTDYKIWGIPFGFFIGEIILVAGLGIGLGKHHFFWNRLIFLIKLSPVLAICGLLRFFIGANLYVLLACLALYVVWIVVFYRKLVFESLTKELAA